MFLFSVISLLKTTSLKRGENARDLASCPTLISLIEKCFHPKSFEKRKEKKKKSTTDNRESGHSSACLDTLKM
jgi:hypothetical protein